MTRSATEETDEVAQSQLVAVQHGVQLRGARWPGGYGCSASHQLPARRRRRRPGPALRPWTRCLRCNGELGPVAKHEIADELRPGTRRCYDRFARCRRCGQVYWQGAHGRRLQALVAAAARAAGVYPGRGG